MLVDGQDVVAVREATDTAVARRAPVRPDAPRIRTFRFVGHSMSDAASGTYRSKEELESSRARDPIALLESRMRAIGMIDDEGMKAIEVDVAAEVADSVQFAEDSPDPEPDELWRDVYAPENG